ncbi:MAG: transposase [Candidatus Thalassarchaeaceae archaeon]|jgi:transposase-like protein|nr:transposase [Candidatus Thalassarchaeaceae archaeon]|tara:strand:- start:50 stop:1294 length:1245 start_codon:yes stop_codon:yes gene_type:complete
MQKLYAGKGEVKVDSDCTDLETRVALIQALIPLGLEAVADELPSEVDRLVGARYARKGSGQPRRRWGSQKGSVCLLDQKLPVEVPRVRNVETNTEVPLESYERLQEPRKMDEGLFLRVVKGISCRNYEACAEAVPEAFGISASSVSRRFIKATARKLKQFQERPLDDYDIVALFVDGKTFADQEMVIALGVTIDGQKIPLGFVETATENERICRQLIQDLIRRGLRYDQGLLVVLDGSKGLYSAITKALKGYVRVQRCQWHKRENVLSYLPEGDRPRIKRKLQKAYDLETYEQAKAALEGLKPELALVNQSAAASLEEGLEETLTLHTLGMIPFLKRSFRTTNCIENVNGLAADLTRKVKRWTHSPQRHRWLAAALLDIEPRLRRVGGYRHLILLRQALKKDLHLQNDQNQLSA